MNLHRAGERADWRKIRPEKRSGWQRLAAVSKGVLTPGNAVSLLGLIFVLLGAVLLLGHHYEAGLIAVIAGRVCDLLDGIVAEKTKTKSPLGEIVDTTADKLALLVLVPALVIEDLLSLWIVGLVLAQNVVNVVIAVIARARQAEVHPTLEGKMAMAAGWATIITFSSVSIIDKNSYPDLAGLLTFAAYIALVFFLVYGLAASRNYARLVFAAKPGDFFRKLTGRYQPLPSLLERVERVVIITNPRSTNARRLERRQRELIRLFPGKTISSIETSGDPARLKAKLEKSLGNQDGLTLIAIGGGDGTVNLVLDSLIKLQGRHGWDASAIAILPLWGGNANDLACMLNGLASQTILKRVLARGELVAIHPLEINIATKKQLATTRYAAAYASFGISAYAAAALERPTHRETIRRGSTFRTLVEEFKQTSRAIGDAPGFEAEQNGRQVKIFEQAFANGERMAKLDRFPVRLTERRFYRLIKTDRHPTPLFYVWQLLQGKRLGEVTDKTFQFVIKEEAWAQFDGEATLLPANTTITVSQAETPFYAVSTRLTPLRERPPGRRLRLLLWLAAAIVAFHCWLHFTNPYAAGSIVQQPYTAYVKDDQIKVTKNFDLSAYGGPLPSLLGYYKSGFLIVQNTFSPSKLTDKKTVSQTIDDIHKLRFDPAKPYLISGNQFSVLYPRNLGVFYNSLLDPRTARGQADWEHRQQIYLQSALYALDAFSEAQRLTTTIVPISPRAVVLTQVHPGSEPSDTLYGMLYAFDALSQPAVPHEKHAIQTIDATQEILRQRRADFQTLLDIYLKQVQDPDTGLVKRHTALSSARDGVVRDSSFYDNVVLWSTLHLADELNIKDYGPAKLADLRTAIINEYWDERAGIFSDEYREGKQSASFSADWLIALPAGFLDADKAEDRAKLVRIAAYTERGSLTEPLPIKYTADEYHGEVPAAVRWFEPNYGGNVIWSYWGAQYISLLNDLQRTTGDQKYGEQARKDLQAYEQRVKRYGGFPETFKPDGTFLKSTFYKSILDTGWVVQYEQARYDYDANND